MIKSSEEMYHYFLNNVELEEVVLTLAWADITVNVQTNSADLLTGLRDYFSFCLASAAEISNASKVINLVALEMAAPELPVTFEDWQREPGKKGRKDSFFALDDGRLLRKVRTGMVFLQSQSVLLAAGPCIANSNQVVNFINSQIMNHLQQQNYLIGHAAAAYINGCGVAFAGFSGGGKSTLMLKLMEHSDSKFISNDRLFLREDGDGVQAVGVPKLPRVNPGTLLNNPRLRGLMTDDECRYFAEMSMPELWDVEQKYDVPIAALYGPKRILAAAPLSAIVILNWRHDSEQATAINPVDITERQELISAVQKSPGPFYQSTDGRFLSDELRIDSTPYLAALKRIQVWELSGKVDIEQGVMLINEQLEADLVCHA
ncbi:Uncharacterised protein [Zhongshania aliphaticivorans]|uniref:HprK-related kinase B n=1 Tax=Zhongshania aliphaticivorans TaxID=1470434 RepID=A0A5S9N7X3_9GAMM|nr:HprK-related kinase B [Zhongshania aliphaticivorans]CAA0081174.1 Uncharacterised protein [Zhongshania aliphaticivorans]CAA0085078.1 Uncharacterised protein [Zhongshania aliphaticivorans]